MTPTEYREPSATVLLVTAWVANAGAQWLFPAEAEAWMAAALIITGLFVGGFLATNFRITREDA